MRARMGILYGTLVAMLVIMGVWWTYFLTGETSVQADLQMQKMATDRLHATFLIQADPRLLKNPRELLQPSFPHLIFTRTAQGVEVQLDPVGEDGSIVYWRDDADVHHVPKRSLEELIIA